ncbi:hypothetical protein MUP77_13275 [Candidatus Bathyarchaeota archaeon]|nr:hypothetical protein [Candidatus Bathyarchaeota archaeon]
MFSIYAIALLLAVLFSLILPYQYLVYLSIGVGLMISFLLLMGMILSGQIDRYSSFFVLGIFFMIIALLSSDLPTKAILLSVRHISLILSLTLNGFYTVFSLIKRFRKTDLKRVATALSSPRLKPYSDFASVFCTTLSNELCSCLHPALALDMLGISILISSQVQTGFILIIVTLTHQLQITSRLWCARAQVS